MKKSNWERARKPEAMVGMEGWKVGASLCYPKRWGLAAHEKHLGETLKTPILGSTPEILMVFERTLLAVVQPGLRTIDQGVS